MAGEGNIHINVYAVPGEGGGREKWREPVVIDLILSEFKLLFVNISRNILFTLTEK